MITVNRSLFVIATMCLMCFMDGQAGQVVVPTDTRDASSLAVVLGDIAPPLDDEWVVIRHAVPGDNITSAAMEVIRSVESHSPDPKKILLVADAHNARLAMTLLSRFAGQVAGAAMLDVSPVEYLSDEMRLLRLEGPLADVPIWVTASGLANRAHCLLSWRRVMAAYPQAPVTLDIQNVHNDQLSFGPGIEEWLLSVQRGNAKSPPTPDAQVVEETRRYQAIADGLAVMLQEDAGPTDAATLPPLIKSEGGMQLTITPPLKWSRDLRGEIKYDSEASPYVQIYVTPQPGGEIFARAIGARWSESPHELLDDYFARLATKGYLVTRYRTLTACNGVVEIASVLWPTETRWHRWLVATWAGGPVYNLAPMVIVMTSSDNPDVPAITGALTNLASTVTVRPGGN